MPNQNKNQDMICDLIASVLKVEKELITNDMGSGDLPEWDSLGHIRIITALLEEFPDRELTDDDIFEIETVGDIMRVFI